MSKNLKKLAEADNMYQFITEIQQALTDKSSGGTQLNVQELSMLHQANRIIGRVNE